MGFSRLQWFLQARFDEPSAQSEFVVALVYDVESGGISNPFERTADLEGVDLDTKGSSYVWRQRLSSCGKVTFLR